MEENIGLRFPLNAQIEVTEECNHSCFYCYNSWAEKRTKNRMSKENVKTIMDILFEQIKPFDVVITGGEPLMNMDVSIEIANRLYERNAPCSMNTNLVLMDEFRLSQLSEANPDISFLISLSHFNEEIFTKITGKNTLDKVLKNMKIVTSKGMQTTINMVLHELNKDSVYEEGKFLIENFGIKSFAATPTLKPAFRNTKYNLNNEETVKSLRDLVRLKEDFGIKINVLEVIPYCILPEDLRQDLTFRRSCCAGRSTIQIAYNGDVRTCGHSPYINGNIFEESFKDIWDRMNLFRKNEYVPEDCKECSELNSCCGGCRYEGLEQGQPLNKKDSRMTEKLSKKMHLEKLPRLEMDTFYKVNLYGTRREGEDRYILYNGRTLLVNEQMKEFVEGIKQCGFRLKDFPINLREKAETFGGILKAGGFLVE